MIVRLLCYSLLFISVNLIVGCSVENHTTDMTKINNLMEEANHTAQHCKQKGGHAQFIVIPQAVIGVCDVDINS